MDYSQAIANQILNGTITNEAELLAALYKAIQEQSKEGITPRVNKVPCPLGTLPNGTRYQKFMDDLGWDLNYLWSQLSSFNLVIPSQTNGLLVLMDRANQALEYSHDAIQEHRLRSEDINSDFIHIYISFRTKKPDKGSTGIWNEGGYVSLGYNNETMAPFATEIVYDESTSNGFPGNTWEVKAHGSGDTGFYDVQRFSTGYALTALEDNRSDTVFIWERCMVDPIQKDNRWASIKDVPKEILHFYNFKDSTLDKKTVKQLPDTGIWYDPKKLVEGIPWQLYLEGRGYTDAAWDPPSTGTSGSTTQSSNPSSVEVTDFRNSGILVNAGNSSTITYPSGQPILKLVLLLRLQEPTTVSELEVKGNFPLKDKGGLGFSLAKTELYTDGSFVPIGSENPLTPERSSIIQVMPGRMASAIKLTFIQNYAYSTLLGHPFWTQEKIVKKGGSGIWGFVSDIGNGSNTLKSYHRVPPPDSESDTFSISQRGTTALESGINALLQINPSNFLNDLHLGKLGGLASSILGGTTKTTTKEITGPHWDLFTGQRWAIELKDINLRKRAYNESGTIIVPPVFMDQKYERVALIANAEIPEAFPIKEEWITYWIDGGNGWQKIKPLTNEKSNIDTLSREQVGPGPLFKVKMELKRPTQTDQASPIINGITLRFIT